MAMRSAAGILAAAACLAASPALAAPGVKLTEVASGLVRPVSIASAKDGSDRLSDPLIVAPQVKSISSFGEDGKGEPYLADLGNGKILRFDPQP